MSTILDQKVVAGDVGYVFVGDVCVSGTVLSIEGDMALVQLVTGHRVSRLVGEIRLDSPRLSDALEWPV